MILAPKKEGQFKFFHSLGRTVFKNILFSCAESVPIISHLSTSHNVPETKLLRDAYALVH